MKAIEQIINEYNTTYLWNDGQTIDLLVDTQNKNFIEEMTICKCLRCDSLLANNNTELLKTLNSTVNGINITCKKCRQKWFVHKPLIIPKDI
jgi:hypothetical protein